MLFYEMVVLVIAVWLGLLTMFFTILYRRWKRKKQA